MMQVLVALTTYQAPVTTYQGPVTTYQGPVTMRVEMYVVLTYL